MASFFGLDVTAEQQWMMQLGERYALDNVTFHLGDSAQTLRLRAGRRAACLRRGDDRRDRAAEFVPQPELHAAYAARGQRRRFRKP